MPKLIIGNVATENMLGETWRMTHEDRHGWSTVANRLAWLAEDGDIILAPQPLPEAFLRYVFVLNGVDRSAVRVVVPPGSERQSTLLTFDVLSSPAMLERLLAATRDRGDWTVLPYYYDRAIAWLVARLGLREHPSVQATMRQGGAEQLNSKVDFRRIAAGHGIPVAEGAPCSSEVELRAALDEFLRPTGAVIVKQDLNAGGLGNVVVTTEALDLDASGAAETILLGEASDQGQVAEQLWRRLTGPRNATLVVEVFYPQAPSYYTELEIFVDGSRPYLLNFGEQRLDPIWVGFMIPCHTLGPYHLAELLSVSMKLADVACARGYVGKLSCDAILTRDGRILFNEINGRLGGCSHIHVLASRFFGPRYGNDHTLLTRNNVKAGPFPRVLDLLEQDGLLYSPGREQGVVVLNEDTERTGTVEYMVAAPTRTAAQELEHRALRTLERSCRP
ncbi:peptide ligase PGM1-related protein [Sorangium sp. So ce887]|uniref:preATP grasp domain-containing protein n=1 Tax=Sorangium sp. So ce887 TaxID=3133324 RepID=UPI003F5E2D85